MYSAICSDGGEKSYKPILKLNTETLTLIIFTEEKKYLNMLFVLMSVSIKSLTHIVIQIGLYM